MAELEFADGHPEAALRAASEVLEIQLRGRDAENTAVAYNNVAAYCIALDDVTGARNSACEGLRIARQARTESDIAIALQHLAVLAAIGGDARRAAQLLGYVDAQFGAQGLQRESTEQWSYDKLMAALRETLSETEIATLGAEGAAWSEDQAAEDALTLSS
jgi:hypothetical protein